MLKTIDPLLSPDLLHILASMGHGDDIAVVDANFPAATMAKRLCRMDGIAAPRALQAILSLLPVDDFSKDAAWRMAVVDNPAATPDVCLEFEKCLMGTGYTSNLVALERAAFYERSRTCFAIVATGEQRLYGNIIVRKGVVRPTNKDGRRAG